jgi:hypothetical protein
LCWIHPDARTIGNTCVNVDTGCSDADSSADGNTVSVLGHRAESELRFRTWRVDNG